MNRSFGIILTVCCSLVAGVVTWADNPAQDHSDHRVLPTNQRPSDARLGELKTLNGHFPMSVPEDPAQWNARSEWLRRQVLVSTGLWPMPEKPPIKANIYGKTVRDGFTVEKVSFESLPGHYVTGLLFRPSEPSDAKLPGVLSPHGHGGRNQALSDDALAAQIASGSEHFVRSGRNPKLARCAQLARMGCVTFIFDMLGYEDSVQIDFETAHRHADARPEEKADGDDSWVFYSPEADLRLQSIMGLQTWNAIRALDFLASLPDVDADRLAVTGGSGGGTQSILLGAIDPRIKVSFPNGMVSTSMQGGCYCENCNLLRIGTGNVELAALFAPRPQAMTAADDWTKDMMHDGYPELKSLYAMIGNADDVYCRPMLHFKHNYNYVTRATMYQWMNRHLELGLDIPVIEQDFEPLSKSEMTVWDDQHPAPSEVGIPHEQSVCRWLDDASNQILALDQPLSEDKLKSFRTVVGGAWQTMMDVDAESATQPDGIEYTEIAARGDEKRKWTLGLVRNTSDGSELPLITVVDAGGPDAAKGIVVWASGDGKESVWTQTKSPQSPLNQLIRAGYTVMIPDVLGQGEFRNADQSADQQRVIDDPRSYSAFTFGYNPTLAASRCNDLLAIVTHARDQRPAQVTLIATEGSAAWAAPAAAIAGDAIDHAVIDTDGFRFASITNYRDPNFVPGSVKYGDLPAILALRSPHSLTVLGEPSLPTIVHDAFGSADTSSESTINDEINALLD
ncbi:Acetyl xylan esterase (AXE1) [Rubripirellula lacrimiformis]|uniref:Acetyl xylan esterase (AXE1) n=1 Tax=Rubripirellula lacrimiformis TaxID=1930273 RepID=A0A517NL77_9BACT|nr:acetylxylan esterase [Rubripirellula lacrimiformis]QDT07886.1 Acetyl xylan esterase (AXE1) [Rubripirellula lacrimiformis]